MEDEVESFEEIEELEKAQKTWQRLRKKVILDKLINKRNDKEKKIEVLNSIPALKSSRCVCCVLVKLLFIFNISYQIYITHVIY